MTFSQRQFHRRARAACFHPSHAVQNRSVGNRKSSLICGSDKSGSSDDTGDEQMTTESLPRTERDSRQRRVQAVLMTYAEPLLKYHGLSAWVLAGKILAVLDDLPAQEDAAGPSVLDA